MTKKDFFRAVIKIMGIFFAINTLLYALPGMIPMFFFGSFKMIQTVISILVIFVFLLFFYLMIFKTDAIIRFLRLDRGFDDKHIHIGTFHLLNSLKIAIIIIGMVLIVKHLPLFISQLVFLLKFLLTNKNDLQNHLTVPFMNDYVSWGTQILKLIIGYLMITNYNQLAKFILKKKHNEHTDIQSS